MRKFMLVLVTCICTLLLVTDVEAQGRRSRRSYVPQYVPQVVQKENSGPISTNFKADAIIENALAEVNEARAKRGLKPYIYDATLAKAALECAKYRAARHMAGHCDGQRGDFGFLPSGYDTNGVVGGCAGLEPSWGFQACAMFDNYTYCGEIGRAHV